MKRYGIIMAGGGGTRFWPLSRRDTPKQLLNLSGKDVMANETAARLLRVTARKDLFVVTNRTQAEALRRATRNNIPSENVLVEPAGRNTAACIGYAAMVLLKKYGDGVMLVSPSDACVRDEEAFARALSLAADCAEQTDGLVTVGVRPSFPATGYGYIRKGVGDEVSPVLQFVEKPDFATAERYVRSGEYLWNSGIFAWKASVILNRLQEFLPALYDGLRRMAESFGTPREQEAIEEIYPSLPAVSVDYGVLEKAGDIRVISASFGWSDVGSWDMLGAVRPADERGNVVAGDVLAADCKNSVLYSTGRTLAVLGAEDMIVVETPDAVMVCPRARAQEVRTLVEELQRNGRKELL